MADRGHRPSPGGYQNRGTTGTWRGNSGNRFNNVVNKPRTILFTSYIGADVAAKGVENGELIQGSLRINQRNYEESYLDNPDGNGQVDLLILGAHDRNRAFHGDQVIVRIKDRSKWVVREDIYQMWQKEQGISETDSESKPANTAVDSATVTKELDTVEVIIDGMNGFSVSKQDLQKNVPKNSECKYERDSMVLIGAQLEVAKQSQLSGGDSVRSGLGNPAPSVQAAIDSADIAKVAVSKTVLPESPKKTWTTSSSPGMANKQKRPAHRTLADLPMSHSTIPDGCLQKTVEVVFIAEVKNARAAMGQLKAMADGNRNYALFSPSDSRIPRMMIPAREVPDQFFDRPHDFAKFIFAARITEWNETSQFARGRLEKTLGLAGDIEAETEGILFANNIDTSEFSDEAIKCLPITEAKQWSIDEKEFKRRRDLRDEIIFTIDPKTARDLDDALHIKFAENVDGKGKSGWEVGVHIADVTHFVDEDTVLDAWAASRATSVYLVHKVIPMLPRILCEELCSLNPGVDRLTFSVIWLMDDEANIYSEWFGKSVIRSKVKLAYEHAQDFIENPDKAFESSELPQVYDDVSVSTIKEKVLHLDTIARRLRTRRMEGGALRLDQPKLKFSFDPESRMPNGVSVYEIKDSNKLVEEYMLLANMAVARKIHSAFPEISILRRHPPPKQKMIKEITATCEKIGFPLDSTSSGLLSKSLFKFQGDSMLQRSINQVLSMLMMKPMQLALYFCTGAQKTPDFHHYALNTPFYTHFTSPIRRYPDMMVHRLLSAALGYSKMAEKDIKELDKQAQHCNEKKTAAKAVSEASDETFFGLFVKQCEPIKERGVVVNVLDASFDVLVFKYGVVKRVYVNKLDMGREATFREAPPAKLVLHWKGPDGKIVDQTIQMCTIVDVTLSALPEPTKYQAVISMRADSETATLRQLLDKGCDLE